MIRQHGVAIRTVVHDIQERIDSINVYGDHSSVTKRAALEKIDTLKEETRGISLYVKQIEENLAGVTYDINGNRVD